jgi:hypothetical protein
MRIIAREERHTTKTSDMIGGHNDGYIAGPEMSGEPVAAPALPLGIILPRLELFSFSGKVCQCLQADRAFR